MKFFNRKKELGVLEEKSREKRSHFFIIYGKRRVGKTELIKQFIKNKPSVYFLSDKRNLSDQLKELGRLFGKYFNDSILESRGFNDWLEVFSYLKEKVKKRFIFAIDEYPYLVELDKSTSAIFQKGWDEFLKDTKVFLILSGSSVAMMESEALLYKSPLYGRRTGQMLLYPFSFQNSRKFYPGKSFDEFLKIFSILGGMPAYLLQFDPRKSLENNIKSKLLQRTELLYNEVEFIIKEELREPKNYLSILKALSFGKTRFGEIINDTGLEKNVLHKYLSTLERLQIIEKEAPVTEKNLMKFNKGIYKINDNFVRFWFQFVFPNKSNLEIGIYNEVLRKINENLIFLVSQVYERVCHEILLNLQKNIFQFERIGRWWDKNNEIDIVGLNTSTGQIIFGEAKWSNKKVGTDIFENLKDKSKSIDWFNGKRKEHFILFSKSGFTPNMIDLAKRERIYLVTKDRLVFKP